MEIGSAAVEMRRSYEDSRLASKSLEPPTQLRQSINWSVVGKLQSAERLLTPQPAHCQDQLEIGAHAEFEKLWREAFFIDESHDNSAYLPPSVKKLGENVAAQLAKNGGH